jgi:2-polyprenyl-3-methyl-5-hydroxy-6-metoxy-1,4-benzoquinol methylase
MSTNTPIPARQPDPGLIMDTVGAHQRSAALKAAVELNVFTAIARGARDAGSLAKSCNASARGIRILCDYLVIIGLLEKQGTEYALTQDSAVFLNRESPAYLGGIVGFMFSPDMVAAFSDLTRTVREGKTILPDQGTVTPDNPVWVEFAKSMAAMMRPAAAEIAAIVSGNGELNVLDIAAGHGLFGIAIARQNRAARVRALDWPDVLAVASENARNEGVADRYSTLSGDAFTVEYGGPYDLVLLTNFLHHFDPPTCEQLLRKVHAALKPAGRALALEFVPNPDRVSPPAAAAFSMVMLGTTPSGDAYTFAEYDGMFRNAGFSSVQQQNLLHSPESIVIAQF